MNYEDRTDLQPPEKLLDSLTLRALATAWPSARDFLHAAFSAANHRDSSVESTLTDVIRPQVELKGGPPQALPVGLAAAKAGYSLGRLMVGSLNEGDHVDLAEVVQRMYVYGLYQETNQEFNRTLRLRLADLIAGAGAPQRADLEEHAFLCFSLGLAVAVVQSDRVRPPGPLKPTK